MSSPTGSLRGRLILALGAGLFSALVSWYQLALPLDRVVYDTFNELLPLGKADDMVIVAIDETSLQEFGRWPWARERHVELLRQLRQYQPKAVAIDILFVEPYTNYPQVDSLLADEVEQLGNVILPVFVGKASTGGQLWEITPLDELSRAAAELGHVHIDVASDGVAREVFLFEGLGAARWPHFSLALAQYLGQSPTSLSGVSAPENSPRTNSDLIIRSHANFIRFMGPAGTVPRVSYADVLKGRVAEERLRGKIVFVGATAAGHTDNITTSYGQIPGVEVNANIFHALRSDSLVVPTDGLLTASAFFLLVFLTILFSLRLPPRVLLAALCMSVVLVFCVSFAIFGLLNLWISPVALAITFLLTYPLWNWLRLAAAVDFMRGQLVELELESQKLSLFQAVPPVVESDDAVEQVLNQLDRAQQEATYNHELVRHTVEEMSSGVVLCDIHGSILLANHKAKTLLAVEVADERGMDVQSVLVELEMQGEGDIRQAIGGLMELGDSFSFECQTRQSMRDVLLQGAMIGLDRLLMIFVLTDITAMKESERKRVEALNFLSHDLRAPLTSVLALIESARDEADTGRENELLAQVESYIRTNLSYAEDFIQISRLDHATQPNFDLCDSASLMDNAVSQVFHSAMRRRIDIHIEYCEEDDWLLCDRHLVERALINLIDNAVKHSDDGSLIQVGACVVEHAVEFSVTDEGAGIAPEDMGKIFHAFAQGKNATEGVGLGLRFVAVVAQAHGGTLAVENRALPATGTSFNLKLPLRNDAETA